MLSMCSIWDFGGFTYELFHSPVVSYRTVPGNRNNYDELGEKYIRRGGSMTDTIITRFRASHSARGMRLSARQNGLIKPKESAKSTKSAEPQPPPAKISEEENDIQ